MRFEVLGPLRCIGPSGDVEISRRREGRILAALLLRANQAVTIDTLIDMLWAEEPPATARQQVQNCVTTLVRLIRAAGGQLPLIRGESAYVLRVGADQLDAVAFEEDVARARAMANSGDAAGAVRTMRAALACWRGPVALGIDLGPLCPAAARLDELRAKAMEQHFGLALQLGRPEEIIADLAAAAAQYPLRERLVGQFMRALAESGRASEALSVYRRTRHMLHEELGIEPGPELRDIHTAVLHGGSSHSGASTAAPEPSSVDSGQRLLRAVAMAERARRQLEVALRGARGELAV